MENAALIPFHTKPGTGHIRLLIQYLAWVGGRAEWDSPPQRTAGKSPPKAQELIFLHHLVRDCYGGVEMRLNGTFQIPYFLP